MKRIRCSGCGKFIRMMGLSWRDPDDMSTRCQSGPRKGELHRP